MKTRQLCIAMTAILFGVLAAGEAKAAPPTVEVPDACKVTPQAKSSYTAGFAQGEKITQMAWNNVKDCDKIDYFLGVLYDNVSRFAPQFPDLPTDPAQAEIEKKKRVPLLCRYAGTTDGVYAKLDALYGTCSDECFADGEFIGTMAGQVYCELSIALGGLVEADSFIRGQVAVCGLNFEFGCDSAFISTTVSYEVDQCVEYTEGQYFNVWDQARNNQCAYEPEPEPAQSSTGNN